MDGESTEQVLCKWNCGSIPTAFECSVVRFVIDYGDDVNRGLDILFFIRRISAVGT